MANPKYEIGGEIALGDTSLTELNTYERAQLGLFLSFQNPTPIEGLSNFRLIKEVLDLKTTATIMNKLNGFRGLAKDLNLPSDWDKKELNVQASGGEKKKNELIQMTMLDPSVAILDEPDSGLDVDAINDLITQLQKFNDGIKTVIIVSHYEKLLKSFTPESVTVVANGTAVQQDSYVIDDVLTKGFKQYNDI
jgi:Fe-S cluster assembly ATP-binding protein